MKFQVKFRGKNAYAIRTNRQEIGLEGLYKVRKDLGLNLPLERIRGDIEYKRWDVVIGITEEQAAEACCHFATKNFIVVIVPQGALNNFIQKFTDADKDTKTGEVRKAWLELEVCKSEIWEAWRDAGFPLEWDPRIDADDVGDE